MTQTRPQPWVLKWQPTHSQRTQVPMKLCVGAFKGPDPFAGADDHRCYSLEVTKCRQCVQLGDTLGSIAAQHNADWLQVYLANPFLPGFNPSHLKPGYNLRLGTHIRNVTLVNATPPLPDLEGMPPARVQIRAVHARSYARVYTGVLYNARWGEDLDRLSQRFFVPQSALLAQNPELAAPTSVAYSPDAPGANTQVSRGVETEGTQCVCAF